MRPHPPGGGNERPALLGLKPSPPITATHTARGRLGEPPQTPTRRDLVESPGGAAGAAPGWPSGEGVGLKIQWTCVRVGSNPTSGTAVLFLEGTPNHPRNPKKLEGPQIALNNCRLPQGTPNPGNPKLPWGPKITSRNPELP